MIEMSFLKEALEGLKGYVLLLLNGSQPQQLALPTVQRIMPGLFSCGCAHPSAAHGLVCGSVVCSMCPSGRNEGLLCQGIKDGHREPYMTRWFDWVRERWMDCRFGLIYASVALSFTTFATVTYATLPRCAPPSRTSCSMSSLRWP